MCERGPGSRLQRDQRSLSLPLSFPLSRSRFRDRDLDRDRRRSSPARLLEDPATAATAATAAEVPASSFLAGERDREWEEWRRRWCRWCRWWCFLLSLLWWLRLLRWCRSLLRLRLRLLPRPFLPRSSLDDDDDDDEEDEVEEDAELCERRRPDDDEDDASAGPAGVPFACRALAAARRASRSCSRSRRCLRTQRRGGRVSMKRESEEIGQEPAGPNKVHALLIRVVERGGVVVVLPQAGVELVCGAWGKGSEGKAEWRRRTGTEEDLPEDRGAGYPSPLRHVPRSSIPRALTLSTFASIFSRSAAKKSERMGSPVVALVFRTPPLSAEACSAATTAAQLLSIWDLERRGAGSRRDEDRSHLWALDVCPRSSPVCPRPTFTLPALLAAPRDPFLFLPA